MVSSHKDGGIPERSSRPPREWGRRGEYHVTITADRGSTVKNVYVGPDLPMMRVPWGWRLRVWARITWRRMSRWMNGGSF